MPKKFFKTVPYRFAPLDVTVNNQEPEYVFLIKGSFSFAPGRAAVPEEEEQQAEFAGDTPYMDEIGRSLRYGTDLVAYKPFGEMILTADCCAPAGQQLRERRCWFEAGSLRKELLVTGDRVWVHAAEGRVAIDGPMPFSRIPLRWERAFGGLAHPENPMGRGMDAFEDADGKRRRYLPNVENPRTPVRALEDAPEPIGVGPVSPIAASRRAYQGTRDQRWALFRAPLPPSDYNPCAEQSAPSDQWVDGYWRGDEIVRLGGMDPVHEVIETRLPCRRPRLFVDVVTGPDTRNFIEVPVALDTVHVDVNERRLILTWRRAFAVATRDASEIDAIYLTEESMANEPAPLAEHYDDYLRRRGPEPEPRELRLERAEAEAVAEARKTLTGANVDPSVLKAFDEAKTAQAKFDLVLNLVKSKTAELERMTANLTRL